MKKPPSEKFDLYAVKRGILKKKRELRNKILGTDTVDGSSMQRFYGEATKTRRAYKIEHFGSKSKASATKGEDTSIEKFVEEILIEEGFEFKKQKAIRYINVDGYVPLYNTVIQIHGCFWHCCPKCYPAGPKNNIQKKNIEKDKVANKIIIDGGYNLVEIWNHEIEETPDEVREKIKAIRNISNNKQDK